MKYYAQRIMFYFLFITVSTDATSQVMWQQVYKDSCPYFAVNAIEDTSGHFFILGSQARSNCPSYKIIEIDQSGNLLNTYYLSINVNGFAFSKKDNRVYVFYTIDDSDIGYYDVVAGYLNQSTGTVDSLYTTIESQNWPDIYQISMDSSGEIYTCGTVTYTLGTGNEVLPFFIQSNSIPFVLSGFNLNNPYITRFTFGKNDTVYGMSQQVQPLLIKLTPGLVPVWQDTLLGNFWCEQLLNYSGQIYTITVADGDSFYLQSHSANGVSKSNIVFRGEGYNNAMPIGICDSQLLVYDYYDFYINGYGWGDTAIFLTYTNSGKLFKQFGPLNLNIDATNLQMDDDSNILVIGTYSSSVYDQYLSVLCISKDSLYSCENLPEINSLNPVFIYPNPGYYNITINVKDNYLPATLNIYNVIGQKMFNGTITELSTNFNTKILANGLYLFQVINNSNSYSTKEIIQNR